MGEKYEGTCVPCVNQKVTSAEEEFSNQVGRITCLDSLFPQPFFSLLNGPMNKRPRWFQS